ncbi:hypothetical protein ANN_03521 [Periplaneta americana]|uniref:DUF4817 domain-containing protein n=1 Tax=Periplaneta americana TaxID=6978 RepID=A0ABQ8TZ72_PERAM|nr:hypothetical protein ANN_03521 [Periplaneta americana]
MIGPFVQQEELDSIPAIRYEFTPINSAMNNGVKKEENVSKGMEAFAKYLDNADKNTARRTGCRHWAVQPNEKLLIVKDHRDATYPGFPNTFALMGDYLSKGTLGRDEAPTQKSNQTPSNTSGAVRSGEQEGHGNGVPREIRLSPKCCCRRECDSPTKRGQQVSNNFSVVCFAAYRISKLSLPSKETLRGHSDSSFRGEGYIQCCVGVRLCDMYSNQELAEIRFMYGKADGNAAVARRLYQERYPQRQCPDRKTFVRLHYSLCVYGKFNSPGLGRGRPRSTTREVQEEILEAVNMTLSISTRRVALQVNVPHTTVWRLLKEYQLYPYHI